MKPTIVMFGGALLYGLTTFFVASRYGIVRPGNALLPGIVFLVGGAAICLGSAVCLFFAVRAAFRRAVQPALAFTLAALVGSASPFVAFQIRLAATRQAELRDLNAVGLTQLRDDVAMLTTANRTRSYPWRWFGGEVPASDLPGSIRRLSTRAAYVTASEREVVIVTDGLGSWRGGYLITPSGSDFIPEQARRITDGVFYVTAR